MMRCLSRMWKTEKNTQKFYFYEKARQTNDYRWTRSQSLSDVPKACVKCEAGTGHPSIGPSVVRSDWAHKSISITHLCTHCHWLPEQALSALSFANQWPAVRKRLILPALPQNTRANPSSTWDAVIPSTLRSLELSYLWWLWCQSPRHSLANTCIVSYAWMWPKVPQVCSTFTWGLFWFTFSILSTQWKYVFEWRECANNANIAHYCWRPRPTPVPSHTIACHHCVTWYAITDRIPIWNGI